jgi:hypothetical protein
MPRQIVAKASRATNDPDGTGPLIHTTGSVLPSGKLNTPPIPLSKLSPPRHPQTRQQTAANNKTLSQVQQSLGALPTGVLTFERLIFVTKLCRRCNKVW